MKNEKMALPPQGHTLLYFRTDQEMVSKMTSILQKLDFECLAPVAWYIAKPKIANSIRAYFETGRRFKWKWASYQKALSASLRIYN